MIEIVDEIDTSTCANCGDEILLGKGDLSLEPEWAHKASGTRSCALAPQAAPLARPRVAWDPETVTYAAAPLAVMHVTREYLTGQWRDNVMMRLRYRTAEAWRTYMNGLGRGDPPPGRMHVRAAWWPPQDGQEPRVVILTGHYDVRDRDTSPPGG